jgi:hypothetical protein
MKRRQPELYATDTCPLSNMRSVENQIHIFTCPTRKDEVQQILKRFVDNLLNTISASEKDAHHIPKVQSLLTEWMNRTSSDESIHTNGNWDALELELFQFHMYLIMSGFVPLVLSEILCKYQMSIKWRDTIPKLIAKTARETYDRVWKKRCTDIVEWEEAEGISAKMKHKKSILAETTISENKSKNDESPWTRKNTKPREDRKITQREYFIEAGEKVLRHHLGTKELGVIFNSKKTVDGDSEVRLLSTGEKKIRKPSKRNQEKMEAFRVEMKKNNKRLSISEPKNKTEKTKRIRTTRPKEITKKKITEGSQKTSSQSPKKKSIRRRRK